MPEPNVSRLPEEIVGPTSRRRLHAALWGMLAIVFVANLAAKWFLDRHPVNQAHRVIAAKWRLFETQKRPVDWLVLGDSSGNHGVIPSVLAERLGGSALNLCTVGSLVVVGDSWMLESYIERVGVPKRVLIVHAYDVWRREINVDAVAEVPLPLGFWSRMSPPVRPEGGLWRIVLDRYAPLYSQDQSLSRLIMYPRKTTGRGFDLDDDGYLHSKKGMPDEVVKDVKAHLAFLSEHQFKLAEENRRALEAIAAIAKAHGIVVYLAGGPVYEGLVEEPVFETYGRQLRAGLRDFAGMNPPLRFLDTGPLAFPAEEMTNADHLIDRAARRYTETLAQAITLEEGRALGGAEMSLMLEKSNRPIPRATDSGDRR